MQQLAATAQDIMHTKQSTRPDSFTSLHYKDTTCREKSLSIHLQGGPAKVKPIYIFAGNISYLNVYSVRQKKVSPKVFCHFLSNRSEFLHEISHIYYSFIIA